MKWTDIVTPRYPPASPDQLTDFERALGVALPHDYREFLLTVNGGPIALEHTLETSIDGYHEETYLYSLYPLTVPKASLSTGIVEFRERWRADKVGIEAALGIGDDGGTGFFFMMLSQRFFGQIYFSYKDVFQSNSPDWQAGIDVMPDYMGLISGSFSELGELVGRAPYPIVTALTSEGER